MNRTRRDFLKRSATGITAAAISEGLPAWAAHSLATPAPTEISVRVTDETRRFQPASSLTWRPVAGAPEGEVISLDPEKKFQEILGFGAAFTEASCYIFNQLSRDVREKLFHQLFHASGLGLSVCRTCIGSSDYSTELYSFDEGEPDPELKRFSIAHDQAYVIPMLRQARQVNPDLFLLSSPWSPPGWMKLNGSMLGGCIHKKYFPVYAQYFVKFLQAYAAEGVPIQALTSQNEVDTDQDGRMPACLWGQEYEIEFVASHLGPALKVQNIPAQIWLIDHNYNLWGRAICELDDPGVKKYSRAIAWHGYAGDVSMISKVRDAHSDVEMHWTEGGPDIKDPAYETNWCRWGRTFTGALRNWCQSITGWNLALDEHGQPNIGPFFCGGLVTIHSKTKDITHSGQYWAFAHFSNPIHRGARRFESSGTLENLDHVGCENPDGEKVVVLTNSSASRKIVMQMNQWKTDVEIPANSLVTLTWK
ncbi:MAG TPA: glycoside hydrolase family 30 beta sandwich domain-containing protein [Verrucomicrobiae bacterium]|nr:glycoside hydrolase family 30 beta sandwich domain-containing protein [Verrucomicrobiae bacterium]